MRQLRTEPEKQSGKHCASAPSMAMPEAKPWQAKKRTSLLPEAKPAPTTPLRSASAQKDIHAVPP